MMKKTRKKNTYLPLYVAAAICLISVSALITVLCLPEKAPVKGAFVAPPFESAAVAGMPEVPDDLGYMECYQNGMGFRFWACGNVKLNGNQATVYLTNPEENAVWLKVRVLDANGNIIGESGLIKPGEYVQAVELGKPLAVGTPIKLKVMAYEPDTYYSAGAVSLNTTVGGVVD